jgi:hypothetical protein
MYCVATLMLAACGGAGGGSSTPSANPTANPTITGLAATGGALANATVTAKCTSGPSVSGSTGVDGTFSLELAGGQTVPCLLQLIKGTVTLHGFAAVAGHINITPLTDLVISRALGSDAASAFAGFDASKGAAITTGLVAAKAYVKTEMTAITGGTQSGDPLTGVFKVGDTDDKVLDNLKTALDNAGKSLDDLRLASVSGGSLAAALTVSLAGTWSGSGVDSNANTGPNGVTVVTWTLAQIDANVSGTVTTQSVDPPNTTCASCHRNKTGTLSGTIAGTTLTLTMSFPAGNPAGNPADVTPICSATLTGTASGISHSSLTAAYSGADACEGPLLDGTLTMARQP